MLGRPMLTSKQALFTGALVAAATGQAPRWSRREESEFIRTLSVYGVDYDPEKEEFRWEAFRRVAGIGKLDKKSDIQLTLYYMVSLACHPSCGQLQCLCTRLDQYIEWNISIS